MEVDPQRKNILLIGLIEKKKKNWQLQMYYIISYLLTYI